MTVLTERRIPRGVAKNKKGNTIRLFQKLTFGSSGAITKELDPVDSGMDVTIVDATAGRYLLEFFNGYKRFVGFSYTLVGPDSSALAATSGAFCFIRDLNLSSGDALLQMADLTDGTDRDATSGNELYLVLEFETGNA